MFVFDLALCSAAFTQWMWCSEKQIQMIVKASAFGCLGFMTCVCVCVGVNCQWVEKKTDSITCFLTSPRCSFKNPHISVSDLSKKLKCYWLESIRTMSQLCRSVCVCVFQSWRSFVVLYSICTACRSIYICRIKTADVPCKDFDLFVLQDVSCAFIALFHGRRFDLFGRKR